MWGIPQVLNFFNFLTGTYIHDFPMILAIRTGRIIFSAVGQ